MNLDIPIFHISLYLLCFTVSLLNLLFILFIYISSRNEDTGRFYSRDEIFVFIMLYAGILIFTAGDILLLLLRNPALNLFFQRSSHIGLIIGAIALLHLPEAVYGIQRKKIPELIVSAAGIMLIPLLFTGHFITPILTSRGFYYQGTAGTLYFPVILMIMLLLFAGIAKNIWYSVLKKKARQKLNSKQIIITAGTLVLGLCCMIDFMVLSDMITLPLSGGEMVMAGMTVFSLLITLLLTQEMGRSILSLDHYSRKLSQIRNQVENEYENILITIADIIERNDVYTAGHSRRVMELSTEIARALKVSPSTMDKVRKSGILHDIGKIGVSNILINKPGRLDPEEFELVKQHSKLGFDIVSQYKPFYEIAVAIRSHHEKMDGSGYPDSLFRQEIPFIARVLSVADVYDALNSKRPYRETLSREKSLEIMQDMVLKNQLDLSVFKTLVDVTAVIK